MDTIVRRAVWHQPWPTGSQKIDLICLANQRWLCRICVAKVCSKVSRIVNGKLLEIVYPVNASSALEASSQCMLCYQNLGLFSLDIDTHLLLLAICNRVLPMVQPLHCRYTEVCCRSIVRANLLTASERSRLITSCGLYKFCSRSVRKY